MHLIPQMLVFFLQHFFRSNDLIINCTFWSVLVLTDFNFLTSMSTFEHIWTYSTGDTKKTVNLSNICSRAGCHTVWQRTGTYQRRQRERGHFYLGKKTNRSLASDTTLATEHLTFHFPCQSHPQSSSHFLDECRHTQSVTRFILPGADVQSREQDGVVVALTFSAAQSRLPVAEAIQRVICMVVDH